MKNDAKYEIVKDILDQETGTTIKSGQSLYRTHGMYYLDGMLMPPYYQEQFDMLTEYEERNGFKYLRKTY